MRTRRTRTENDYGFNAVIAGKDINQRFLRANIRAMRRVQKGRLLVTALFTLSGFVGGISLGFYLWRETTQVSPAVISVPAVADTAPKSARAQRRLTAFQQMEQEVIALIARRSFHAALELLMQAELVVLHTEAEVAQLSQLLDETVKRRVDQLMALQKFGEVDALYESLTLAMPERAEYYLLLAEFRIEMDNPEAALPVLAQIENHHRLGGKARELIALLSTTDDESPLEVIPLERSGDQFLIQATVDDFIEVTLLIDTGASMTILAPGVLRRLGYSLNGPTVNFSTANGVVRAPLVSISSFSLGSQRIAPMRIGALGLTRARGRVDGLLGMDFLSQFEFALDQDAQLLNLLSTLSDQGSSD